MQEIQCPIEKVNIISLPTLFSDKTLITKYIDIFKKYLQRLRIKNIVIINKLFIFKRGYFTIYFLASAIY